jgi:tetratricopeptide (TPR) repeat protein
MSRFDHMVDASFREYADLQLRRHSLLLEGKENAAETLEAEEQMEELWEKLDETQRHSLNGMASDLNWIRRNGEPPSKGRKTREEVTERESQELLAAMESKDWHALLNHLRVCAPTLPPVHLGYLRGTAYDALGFPGYARVFFEQAAEFDPANASMGVLALRYVEKTNPENAIRRANKILESPLRHSPVLLAWSVGMILRRHETEGLPIDRKRFSAVLTDIVKRLPLEPPDAARAMAYQAVAAGFEIVGEPEAALRGFDEGLKLAPNNELLLMGKGLLLYGRQTDEAIELFGRLVRQETASVWPYFFLTHYHLLQENYSSSLEMGREAWARAAADPVRAELLEWQAICLTELHYPSEVVRSIFEKALALDPSNPWISKNLASFERAGAKAKESEWHIEEASRLKTQRDEGMRELEHVGVP